MANDRYLWLEDILSEKSMKWVKEENERILNHFQSHPKMDEMKEILSDILERDDKLKIGQFYRNHVYTFISTGTNPKGQLKRISKDDYIEGKDHWEKVLDIDELCRQESKSWVYQGMSLNEEGKPLAMITLSDGGLDSAEIREFDLDTLQWVEDQSFFVPESKSNVDYLSEDCLLFGDAYHEDSKTSVGYVKTIKKLHRGQQLDEAKTLISATDDDMVVSLMKIKAVGKLEYFFVVAKDFYCSRTYYYNEQTDSVTALALPSYCNIVGCFQRSLMVQLTRDWELGEKKYSSGSLLAFDFDEVISGRACVPSIVIPYQTDFIVDTIKISKNRCCFVATENVISSLYELKKNDDVFSYSKLNAPEDGSIFLYQGSYESDLFQFAFTNYTTPTQLYLIDPQQKISCIQSKKTNWDSSDYLAEQCWGTSADGVKVPYFILKHKDTVMNGKNPTILYGYGGFQISYLPSYYETIGRAWLDQGGVYVFSNIRGGAEFGAKWHSDAILQNKQRSYDDFIAIAEDLIAMKLTSPDHLGISGGSNGGLLVGAVCVQRPDLFKAVRCAVPLLDMLRYTVMKNAKGDTVGLSWAAEYGNPIDDDEMREYISTYSPYQNLKADVKMPHIFFGTSTKDDRVVPSHARKMAAKMKELGYDYWFYENIEGGHGMGADLKQHVMIQALTYLYFLDMLNEKHHTN